MKVMGVVGWKNAGKTRLVVNLVEHFVKSGYEVSTVKHAHHDFDVDHAGKDSYEHRKAGAHEVLVASDNRWALMHELRRDEEPPLTELLSKIEPVDLVIVEGFKLCKHPKIEVYRPGDSAEESALLAGKDCSVCAVATDMEGLDAPCPVLPLNDVAAVAHFIQDYYQMRPKTALA